MRFLIVIGMLCILLIGAPTTFAAPSCVAGFDTSRGAAQATGMRVPALNAFEDGLVPSGLAQAAKEAAASGDDMPLTTRGAKDAAVFRNASPSVVLVVTDGGLGSGSVIDANTILTNWHVIRGYKTVGVIFKPANEGAEVEETDVVTGKVIKIDQARDLALISVRFLPSNIKPIALAEAKELEIGADVHAIGHPTGETWTYTKGVISQIRNNFSWKTGSDEHKATVIQTQTPINPGNSGGPLLSDAGRLVGVNTFIMQGADGLNFAVALSDVKAFLERKSSDDDKPVQSVALKEPKLLFEGRTKSNIASFAEYDVFGNGRANLIYLDPDDKKDGFYCFYDRNDDEKVDIWIVDEDRDGNWDYSFVDSDFDGNADLEGVHPNGELMPTSYKPLKK